MRVQSRLVSRPGLSPPFPSSPGLEPSYGSGLHRALGPRPRQPWWGLVWPEKRYGPRPSQSQCGGSSWWRQHPAGAATCCVSTYRGSRWSTYESRGLETDLTVALAAVRVRLEIASRGRRRAGRGLSRHSSGRGGSRHVACSLCVGGRRSRRGGVRGGHGAGRWPLVRVQAGCGGCFRPPGLDRTEPGLAQPTAPTNRGTASSAFFRLPFPAVPGPRLAAQGTHSNISDGLRWHFYARVEVRPSSPATGITALAYPVHANPQPPAASGSPWMHLYSLPDLEEIDDPRLHVLAFLGGRRRRLNKVVQLNVQLARVGLRLRHDNVAGDRVALLGHDGLLE